MTSERPTIPITTKSFARSSAAIFALWVGIAIAEFVGVLYVARAVGASVFGQYALFAAIIFFAYIFTDMGTEEATKKRISEGRSHAQYFAASLLMRYLLFLVVALVFVVLRAPITSYIGSAAAFPYLVLSLFFMVTTGALSSVLAGNKMVARSVSLHFVGTVVRVIVWVLLISLGYGFSGLLLGFLAGPVVGVALGTVLLPHSVKRPEKSHFLSIFQFARYSWLSSFKETSWVWTDTLVLGLFVVPALVGIYEISWQISAVFFFGASAVSTTLFPNISELWTAHAEERVQELVEFTLVYAGIVAIPGLVGAIFLGDHLLAVFGEEFTAGYLVLVVLIFARVIHSYEIVLEKLIHALDRPDLMFRANAVFVGLTVVLNVLFISLIEWRAAAVATAVSMLVKTVLVYFYASRQIVLSIPTVEISIQGVSAGVMGIALFLIPIPQDGVIGIVTAVGIGGLVYGFSLLVLSKHVRNDLLSIA